MQTGLVLNTTINKQNGKSMKKNIGRFDALLLKAFLLLLVPVAFCSCATQSSPDSKRMVVWYDKPAGEVSGLMACSSVTATWEPMSSGECRMSG